MAATPERGETTLLDDGATREESGKAARFTAGPAAPVRTLVDVFEASVRDHPDELAQDDDEDTSYTSARNAFPGIVTGIELGDIAAQVTIQAGPHRLVSLLTREAVEELGLDVGMQATARVKSTSVHIDRT